MTYQEKRTQINNHRIHYLKKGTGKPIILIHGGSSTAKSAWKKNIDTLSTKGEVYAIDLPGFGASNKPKLEYSTQLFTNYLKRFIEKKDLENIRVIGNSMGGAISFTLATQTDKIDKLALVDSYGLAQKQGYSQKPIYLLLNIPYLIDEVGWRIQQLINKHWIEWAFFKWLKNDWGWEKIKTNIKDIKDKINQPTLIIHGKKDKIVNPKQAKKTCEKISDCELKYFNKCGHWPQKQNPQKFNKTIIEFINKK